MRGAIVSSCLILLAAMVPAAADEDTAIAAARGLSKVVNVTVDDGRTMYLWVKPERLAWDNLAVRACGTVRPHKARIFRVKVVDMTSMQPGTKPAQWKIYADAKCG